MTILTITVAITFNAVANDTNKLFRDKKNCVIHKKKKIMTLPHKKKMRRRNGKRNTRGKKGKGEE